MGVKSDNFNKFIKENEIIQQANDLAFKYMTPLKRREKNKSMYNHVFDVAKFVFDSGERDTDIIASAFLHDIIEDSHKSVKLNDSLILIDKEYLLQHFNPKIANIVDNLTNFSSKSIERKINLEFKEENIQSDETYYKLKRQSYVNGFIRHMLYASNLDILESVLLIKFFDRFHNMKTLQYHKKFKQNMIAKESLDIYIPLFYMVEKIPIKSIDEMIEMTFKYLYTDIYENRKIYLEKTKEKFQREYEFIQEYIKEMGYKNIEVIKKPRSLYRLHLTKSNFTGLNYAMNEIIILDKENKDNKWSEKKLFNIMIDFLHKTLEDSKEPHYILQDEYFKYSLNGDTTQSYLRPLPAIRLKLYSRENKFMFQMNLTTKEKLAQHYTRRNIKDWINNLREVENNIIQTSLESTYKKLKADFLKPVVVYTPNGAAHCMPNDATIRDYAFNISTELGIYADYALVNQVEKVSVSEPIKEYHGNIIEIVKSDINEVLNFRKIYSEVQQASSERDIERFLRKDLKNKISGLKYKQLNDIIQLFIQELKMKKEN